MLRITVGKTALRAIVKFAADKDQIRYYLAGVLLEAAAKEKNPALRKHLIISATHGREQKKAMRRGGVR